MSPRLMHKKRKPRRAFPSRPTPQRGVGRERGKVVAVTVSYTHLDVYKRQIVLLLQKGAAELRPDVVRNTADGVETRVRQGERIGHAKRK